MGTPFMLTSVGLFIVEVILQITVIAAQSQISHGIFFALLAIVVIPVIVVNIVSAVKIIRTHDFIERPYMRTVCVVFHTVQIGIVWRAMKLFLKYDGKEWSDFLQMRLFHCGFQSIPFFIVLTYSMFVHSDPQAVSIISVIISVVSASVAFATYRTEKELYDSEEFDRTKRVRKIIGMVFLTFSYVLVLFSRCSSIVLFSVVQPAWIALPLSVHLLVHVAIGLCRINRNQNSMSTFIISVFYKSFVNIFEKVGKGYTGVKCSYVFYYSMLLVEDLVLVFYWMLAADYGERLKLMTTVVVLVSFVIGIIIKFASCGCIYNIESDILSEAFTNPELKEEFDKKKADEDNPTERTTSETVHDGADGAFKEILVENQPEDTYLRSPVTAARHTKTSSENRKPKRSKQGSSSASSTAHKIPYDNHAYNQSQGNISVHSPSSHSSTNIGKHLSKSSQSIKNGHQRDSDHHRQRSRDGSRYSSEQRDSHRREKQRSNQMLHHSDESHNRSRDTDIYDRHNSSYDNPSFSIDREQGQSTPRDHSKRRSKNKTREINNLIISDTSIYANRGKPQKPLPIGRVKGSTADLSSSKSRYSRNTNTLNGSVLNYHYNGFDDPYRERRAFENRKYRHKHDHRHHHHYHHRLNRDHHRHRHQDSFMDYSLDSSELYPSLTSDSESMTSYEYTNRRHRQTHRQKPRSRNRHYHQGDGYSTDVSNSDYLSFNDYSMEDSSSWTESSDSESAVTWPPSHTSNLLKMYDIADSVSSKDNVMHWLDTMEEDLGGHDASFSTLVDPSIASETDISLSAMQDFEVTKTSQKRKFKRLIPKPKEVLLKFRSLNYKNKQKHGHKIPYPLQQSPVKSNTNIESDNRTKASKQMTTNQDKEKRLPLPTMPLPIDSVQESIV